MEKPHKRLDAWNESINLVCLIYALAKELPKNEE